MTFFPVFLSIVYIVRNQGYQLESVLQNASSLLTSLVADYELIIVDNSSEDESLGILKNLIGQAGYPNVQVYALTKEVDTDIASWVGLENALGDFVAVIDPLTDDIGFLPQMLDKAVSGIDIVFANNKQKPRQSYAYRVAYAAFNILYKSVNGIHLSRESSKYRLFSKRIVNFILQHPQPSITYRHLPAMGGFSRINMEYSSTLLAQSSKKLGESIDQGMRLLVSTTRVPMRLVTSLSLFGAIANLIYSVYVVFVSIFKPDVAPGWASLSLQQSGMFFLISLVLLVLGEYLLYTTALTNQGPLYHVGQEFSSVRMLRKERLNIEDASSSPTNQLNKLC